ncbi:hypothetical protein ACFFUP_16550 [Vibrio ostreicida]|uniref:Uncharacterized protein n=1 Tax=Vibrio ostreicida TaxID=526588 RepID=A0ABT8BYH7_9VIBR|nr:hypothetical protein [Vibrio ostreicida]MDN3611877.1 hypothetical protein [Vibrio ostreicida]NPD10941.1 hypothetical protein [Vibrio ostreicida]
MTFNKYFVFVSKALQTEMNKENERKNHKETQRQAFVKQAQQHGGLIR